MAEKYNWELIRKIAFEEGPFSSQIELGRFLGIPPRTISGAIERGELPRAVIQETTTDEYTQTLRFLASRATTVDEIVDAYGIDRDEWEVADFSVGSRELVRLDKDEDNTPQVRWNWRIKLVRRKLELDPLVPKQVIIEGFEPPPSRKIEYESSSTVLFLSDSHFGYKGDEPTFDSEFLTGVFYAASEIKPDFIVWGGDQMDFPCFSTFTNDPAYNANTQRALNNCASYLALFATLGSRQIWLDGNHEARIDRMLQKHIPELYGLHAAGDHMEIPVLSIRNLLNLDALGVDYIPGWRDGSVEIDGVRYTHGTRASTTPGATAKAMLDEASISTVFGHVHRREILTKRLADTGQEIFVGTPGMTCNLNVPGATQRENWQAGAFVIVNGNYPELISYNRDGNVAFRGEQY